jgi:4-hydroxybenzoyl-CoA thioesterase
MIYSRELRIEFSQCDPAGIVFFPRFFEMMNSQVENFFRDVLERPFEQVIMVEGHGVPTARIEIDFRKPARLGEVLRFELTLRAIGRSSLDVRHRAFGASGDLTLEAAQRLVWVGADMRSRPWPEDLRARLAPYLEENP